MSVGRARWTTPLGFEAQCWIAWSGLAAFGASDWLQYRTVGAYPPLEGGALVLAVCWAIDLVRTGRALRRAARARTARSEISASV